MLLDFEKPIAELENKLGDMKHLTQDSDKEVQGAINALEKKIKDLKKETFANLTGWQRVQLSRRGPAIGTQSAHHRLLSFGDVDRPRRGGFGSNHQRQRPGRQRNQCDSARPVAAARAAQNRRKRRAPEPGDAEEPANSPRQ